MQYLFFALYAQNIFGQSEFLDVYSFFCFPECTIFLLMVDLYFPCFLKLLTDIFQAILFHLWGLRYKKEGKIGWLKSRVWLVLTKEIIALESLGHLGCVLEL